MFYYYIHPCALSLKELSPRLRKTYQYNVVAYNIAVIAVAVNETFLG